MSEEQRGTVPHDEGEAASAPGSGPAKQGGETSSEVESGSAEEAPPTAGAAGGGQGADPEVAAGGSGSDGAGRRRPRRVRRFFATFLVVLFAICLFVSSLSIWAVRQVLNTDVFVSHVNTAIQDPNVQDQISTYVANEVVTAVNPKERFDKVLPKKAQVIVAPVVGAFHQVVYSAVHKLVVSPTFQRVLLAAVAKAHSSAVNLLEGKTSGNLVLNGNEVVLNTLPLIDQTISTLEHHGVLSGLLTKVPPLATANGMPSQQVEQLSHKLGVTLPPGFGQIVVFRSNTLHAAQVALKKLHRALVLMLLLTVVLAVLAIVVSPRKLRTVVQMGIGAVIVGLATWAGTIWVTNEVVSLAKTGQAKGSMRAILQATTSGLVSFMWVVIIVGLIAALLAFVFGESALAARIRAWVKRVAARVPVALGHVADFIRAHVDGFRIAGYGIGIGIVFLWLSLAGLIAAVVVEVVWQVGLLLIRGHAEPPTPPEGSDRGSLATVTPAA